MIPYRLGMYAGHLNKADHWYIKLSFLWLLNLTMSRQNRQRRKWKTFSRSSHSSDFL